jgi:hypothetical protein
MMHHTGQGCMSVSKATVTYTQDLSDSSHKKSTRCSSKQLQIPQKNSASHLSGKANIEAIQNTVNGRQFVMTTKADSKTPA